MAIFGWFDSCVVLLVLIKNGDKDEKIREKSHKIEKWPSFVWIARQRQCRTIETFDDKGNGEKEKEAISRISPEAQEKQPGQQ
jgi:hypothetical protein